MCGRFNLIESKMVVELMRSFGFRVEGLDQRFLQPQYNIAPTDPVLVAGMDEQGAFLRPMRWWLIPSWSDEVTSKYAMFNARSENLRRSKAFARPYKERRCVIPASGFIEWQTRAGVKQPWFIYPKSGLCFFGGLWDRWERGGCVESCTIITTEASHPFSAMHSRMPFLLEVEQIDQWLDRTSNEERLRGMIRPCHMQNWEAVPVSTRANNSRNKTTDAASAIAEPAVF